MVSPYASLITPSIHALTLAIIAVSAYSIHRQQSTSYNYVKNILVIVYALFGSVILSEFVRVIYEPVLGRPPGPVYMRIYTEGATTLILTDVLLLTLAAATIYFRPSGYLRGMFSDVLENARQRVAFFLFSAYVVFADLYLLIFRPYHVVTLKNLWGVSVVSSPFNENYLVILAVVLAAFLLYPSYLLLAASRKAAEPAIRRALIILPICWSAIGLDLMIFNGYLWTVGVDANDAGYLVAGTVFSVTAIVFRRASVLAGFFEVKPSALEVPFEYPFSKRMGVGRGFLARRSMLMEVDPSTDYEKVILDFAKEVLSTKQVLFVFTSRGSPIHRALSDVQGVIGITRFFILTDKVSYPKPSEGQVYEVMVPQHDQPVLLDVLDKTLRSNPDGKIAVLFDSISDLILSLGLEKSYLFLKQANEIISDPRVTSLFLVSRLAHDDKSMTLIRSLFPNHLSYDAMGLKVTKQA